MSALTPASEVILRHSDEFIARHVLFAGDLQDALPAQFDAAGIRVHTNQYHHWQLLSNTLDENVQFGLVATPETVTACDTLVYYWPKSKQEAQFQLANLLSLLPVGCDVFVVGENRSGVRSAEEMLSEFAQLTKIDSARRCGLYHGRLDKQPEFDADAWWESYQVGDVIVKTLPGVFSRDALDSGSHLLLSTFSEPFKGSVLDAAFGSHEVLAQNGRFKVYQATVGRPPRDPKKKR